MFLWLLINNRVLTRDNLAKRRKVEDKTCLFCAKKETCQHLFFDCVVAKRCWVLIYEIIEVSVGEDMVNIGKFWLSSKRNSLLNIVTSVVLWSIWKLRNELYF
jgi:hypothetical protein